MGLSIVHWAEAFGVPDDVANQLRAWQEETPCYCDKMTDEMITRTVRLLEMWRVAKSQNKSLEELCVFDKRAPCGKRGSPPSQSV
jgi:hypothetical protein